MNVITYAKKENHPLLVQVTGDGEKRKFKLTVKQYKEKIRRYCAFFGTVEVSRIYDDIEETVKLANGIEFNAMLY